MSEVEVVPVSEPTPELLAACHRLIPQLSASSQPLTYDELCDIIDSPCTTFFVARSSGSIVGMLTLAMFRIPTGIRAWIEDVVVDASLRGSGIGEVLNRTALEFARSYGARTVDLTSRPTRESANRLYQRIGFVARDTNVYRYEF